MTDTYTIEQIREAIEKVHVYPDWGGDDIDEFCDNVTAELTRPQHEFREGEVVFHSYLEDDQPTGEYFQWEGAEDIPSTARPLRLSEMPQAVEDLRNAIDCVLDGMQGGMDHLANALAAFDEKVKP